MEQLRVLLADDDEGIRDALSRLLRSFGFTIAGAVGDGHAAVFEAKRLELDVILLDVTMPSLGGLKALPLVREHQPFAAIIVLTSDENPRYRDEAFRVGADAFIPKRRAPSELVPAILEALAVNRARAHRLA
jgi:two-component system invasion response regulator UvrY